MTGLGCKPAGFGELISIQTDCQYCVASQFETLSVDAIYTFSARGIAAATILGMMRN
jgi:adenine/guanine phosphoribosyltransferase-like PRPP-binding protein